MATKRGPTPSIRSVMVWAGNCSPIRLIVSGKVIRSPAIPVTTWVVGPAAQACGPELDCSGMRACLKLWIESEDGHVALSEWRVTLLEAVREHGSLVAAARALGVPHRTAWQRIREMEPAWACNCSRRPAAASVAVAAD